MDPVSDIYIGFLTLLNGPCRVCVICLGSKRYGFALSWTFSEKVLLKHPIPVKTPLNSLCMFIVVLTLVALSASEITLLLVQRLSLPLFLVWTQLAFVHIILLLYYIFM